MRDSSPDLALLPTLDALLRERSVTRAARALGRSQPAISRELASLREQFGDLLLVRTKAGMTLTPRAQALQADLARVLGDARSLLTPTRFDPAEATCEFRVSMNDYEAAVLLPEVCARLRREAPRTRMAVVQRRRKEAEDAVACDDIHLAIGRFVAPGPLLHQADLFEDEFLVFGCKDRAIQRDPRDLDSLLSSEFVIVSPGNTGDFEGLFDDALRALGRERIVVFSVANFLLLPALLASGDVLALAPRSLGSTLEAFGLSGVAPPLPMPRFGVSMLWHQRRRSDPASMWLRALFVDAARGVSKHGR